MIRRQPEDYRSYGGRLPAIPGEATVRETRSESDRREAPVSGPAPLSGKARPPNPSRYPKAETREAAGRDAKSRRPGGIAREPTSGGSPRKRRHGASESDPCRGAGPKATRTADGRGGAKTVIEGQTSAGDPGRDVRLGQGRPGERPRSAGLSPRRLKSAHPVYCSLSLARL